MMRVAPMFALYRSVPKKGALQLGTEMSSVPSDGNRTLTAIAAFHSKHS